jgi:hypothetical protein
LKDKCPISYDLKLDNRSWGCIIFKTFIIFIFFINRISRCGCPGNRITQNSKEGKRKNPEFMLRRNKFQRKTAGTFRKSAVLFHKTAGTFHKSAALFRKTIALFPKNTFHCTKVEHFFTILRHFSEILPKLFTGMHAECTRVPELFERIHYSCAIFA